MASGELMVAIAVTEPDSGSDVASLRTTATQDGDGWRINGVKTWCTFGARADVFMLLARTDPDRSKGHKGLSLFVVPKERGAGHGFELSQEEGGNMEGRAIDTIGYRGMHSYEVAFDNWYVPAENLIGGEEGLGRGFYLQMAGFENGRIQTAARAVGVMQAAYEAACDYASERSAFGKPIIEFQLTRAKLARMAVIIQASRQFAYHVARLMAQWATPRSFRSAAITSMPGCCRSLRERTRSLPSRSSPGGVLSEQRAARLNVPRAGQSSSNRLHWCAAPTAAGRAGISGDFARFRLAFGWRQSYGLQPTESMLTQCGLFGIPSTSLWTDAAITVQFPRTKRPIVTRRKVLPRPMLSSSAG